MFDLSAIKKAMKDEGWVEILHPKTDEKTGAKILVAGPDSERAHKVDAQVRNRLLSSNSKIKNRAITVEQLEDGDLDRLVGITLGWENIVFDGNPLEFSLENALTVYSDYKFIREQVIAYAEDRRNFLSE